MADGGITLQIDEALAERLKLAAQAAGETVDAFARKALEAWSGDEPDWDEVDRIAMDTVGQDDGIPFGVFEPELRAFGRPKGE
jgi:hypothetical protein